MNKKLLEEVYPGIFRITERGAIGLLKPPVNIYVITGSNGLVYDAGYGNRSCVKKFSIAYREINKICRERGIENHIDRILLSHAHADHFAGLKRLRKRWGFRVIITDEMKTILKSGKSYHDSYTQSKTENKKSIYKFASGLLKLVIQKIEFTIYSINWGIDFMNDPDIIIASECLMEINDEKWEIFSSPGHSADHITLYNRKKGILFSGDNVMKSINVWLGPPKSDLDDYEKSLKKMLKLPVIKLILPAHGSPILKPYERLNEIIEWRKKRTKDIINILKEVSPEGVSIKEILNKLYPADSRMKKEFAGGWIELTLQKLEKETKIYHDNGYYFYLLPG